MRRFLPRSFSLLHLNKQKFPHPIRGGKNWYDDRLGIDSIQIPTTVAAPLKIAFHILGVFPSTLYNREIAACEFPWTVQTNHSRFCKRPRSSAYDQGHLDITGRDCTFAARGKEGRIDTECVISSVVFD